jgi:putative hydrolase
MKTRDPLRLHADLHVHSKYSDGRGSLRDNVEAAGTLGLERLGLVDHVRAESSWVPAFGAAVEELRAETSMELVCGVEAKILDQAGLLDLPPDLTGVQRIVAADHRFPGPNGPVAPQAVREAIADGRVSASAIVEGLVSATAAAMRANPGLLVAHLFSLLPKVGLNEWDVSDEQVARLAEAAAASSAVIEISERWKCPSVRAAGVFRDAGVEIVPGSDAHDPSAIGRYDYVAAVFLALDAAHAPAGAR